MLEYSGRAVFALYDPIKEDLIRGISNLQGLSAWSSIGQRIRDALMAGRQLVIFNETGGIDMSKLVNYFLVEKLLF